MARTATPESAKRTQNIFPPPAIDGLTSANPVVVNVTTAKYMLSIVAQCSTTNENAMMLIIQWIIRRARFDDEVVARYDILEDVRPVSIGCRCGD